MTQARRRDRRGFALITVVLLMVGLAVLATGLVFASAQHATMAASAQDVVRARHAATSALGLAIDDWNAAERVSDPIGSQTPLLAPTALGAGLSMSVASERVAADLFLLTATGTAARGGRTAIGQRAASLVRSLDIAGAGLAFDAAVVAGAVAVGEATLQGDGPDAPARDPAAAALCGQWPVDGAGLRTRPAVAAALSDAAITGSPAVIADADAARFLDGIGFLDFETLAAFARPVTDTVLSPAPVSIGASCDTTAAGSWGGDSPPCDSHWPLLYADGDVRITGGYGQGILLARGDLVLDDGFRFRGIVIALGRVTVGDATIEGALIAADFAGAGGLLSLDRCAVADALTLSPTTRRAHPPTRRWLPVFD